MIKAIAPMLKEGILIFGADKFEEDKGSRVLSELSTLRGGRFPQAQKPIGQQIIKMTINKIFEYADECE